MSETNFNQQDLFDGNRIIKSIEFNEQQIIRDIIYLHGNGKQIDCDPCYSIGNFYKNGIQKPKHIFDLYPKSSDVIKAFSWDLPLKNESCEIINFDHPFIISGQDTQIGKESSKISKRFSEFKDFYELKFMYYESLVEFYRILKNNGIVIFKCQDVLNGGVQYLTHSFVIQSAIDIGFYPKDLFILLAKSRAIGKFNKQRHARKFHCYYIVLKKCKCNADYSYGFKL